MKTLYYEEEIFEVLYNLSVGFERLLKVAVVLIEYDFSTDQEKIEKSLITHSHLDLLARIRKHSQITTSSQHNEFLQLLGVFYKTYRYDRYSLSSVGSHSKEKQRLHEYLEKHLDIEIQDDFPLMVTENSPRIKQFIGKIVGKIAIELYQAVRSAASKKNIFTYEIRYDSKASKIFLAEEFDFTKEDILWKEIVLFLMNTKETTSLIRFLKGICPLEFDPALIPDYLEGLGCDTEKLKIMGELDALYGDISNLHERLEMLRLIGNPNVYFDDDDDEEET